jgi:hypothetical protein
MENKSKNKNKKRLLILVALVGVMGVGGVVAATSITINSGVPISLGAGYTTASTCDTGVTITAAQGYDSTTDNRYEVNAFNISNVDITSAGCANKTMQLAVVYTSGTPSQASWTLASSAATDAIYQFGATGNGTSSGLYRYASATLTAFDIATLSTVALSIA